MKKKKRKEKKESIILEDSGNYKQEEEWADSRYIWRKKRQDLLMDWIEEEKTG